MRQYSISLDYSQGISKNGRKHYFTDRTVDTFNKRIQSGLVFGEYGPPTRETSEHPSSFLKRIHHISSENIALKVVLFELDKYDRTKCIVTVKPSGTHANLVSQCFEDDMLTLGIRCLTKEKPDSEAIEISKIITFDLINNE